MNEKSMGVMFSSNTDLWATPIQTFQQLNKAFNFNLDVCASDDNAKCENYFTKEIDGLQQEWIGSCFMNPPHMVRLLESGFIKHIWNLLKVL